MSTTEAEIVYETELDRVVGWRLRELRRGGYDEAGARAIAERVEIDLHRAVDLLPPRDGAQDSPVAGGRGVLGWARAELPSRGLGGTALRE